MRIYDKIDFSPYFHSPEELANKVLQVYFKDRKPVYPIDPFHLMKIFGIPFQFREFEKLEGIYFAPEDEGDIPLVAINQNRPITRQRFTAAHEICHHIKDRESVSCPLDGRKNGVERYADSFATALLMPRQEILRVSDQFLKNGVVEFEDVIQIADYFGVSFQACVYRLAYDLKRISGPIESEILRRRIIAFKPDKYKIEHGLEKHDAGLLKNIINNYEYFIQTESGIVWNKFKIDFIYHENRLEGLVIDLDDVAEIVTDLRMKGQKSEFCKAEYQTIIEVAGHSEMYDFVSTTEDRVTIYSLLKLNRQLYGFAPYLEGSGSFRETNPIVTESKFEICDSSQIISELQAVEMVLQDLLRNKDKLSLAEFIDEAVKIHHRLTVIHPFNDGNGRVTRAFLNWMFKLKGLPPVYIKIENKGKYLDGLAMADRTGNYEPLCEVFYREVMRSMIELNQKFM